MSSYILFNTPLSDTLIIMNAVVCGIIAVRLMFFQRNGSKHRRWGGIVAYIMIVAYASFPIRLAFGQLVVMDWTQVVVNAVICCALIKTRGNVVQLFKVSR